MEAVNYSPTPKGSQRRRGRSAGGVAAPEGAQRRRGRSAGGAAAPEGSQRRRGRSAGGVAALGGAPQRCDPSGVVLRLRIWIPVVSLVRLRRTCSTTG